jgi:quercetin dioxygenase-like cupin family protein
VQVIIEFGERRRGVNGLIVCIERTGQIGRHAHDAKCQQELRVLGGEGLRRGKLQQERLRRRFLVQR